jgi:ABC-type lipoprotein release transport system permease subunit
MAAASPAELVFVVDVTSLTSKGFVGSSQYAGKKVDIDFDDGDSGVFLSSEMAARLHVKKGSKVALTLEDDHSSVVDLAVAGVGKTARISDPKIYYAVGREGGAIIRVRKA